VPSGEFDDDQVIRLRSALSRIVRQLERQTNEDGLTRTELNLLGTLTRRRHVSLVDLAGIEGINPTMLSRIVRKLDDIGYVRRVPDEHDRRVIHAEITPEGQGVWENNRKVRTDLLSGLLDGLPAEQAAAVMAALPGLEALAVLVRPTEVPAAPRTRS